MFIGRNFDPANPTENQVYGYDFINDLSAGDYILNVTTTLTVQQGTDPTPSLRLVGSPQVLSSSVAVQRIAGLLAGTTYTFLMTAITNQGDSLSLYSHIPGQAVY